MSKYQRSVMELFCENIKWSYKLLKNTDVAVHACCREYQFSKMASKFTKKGVFHCRYFPVSCLKIFQSSFVIEHLHATACGNYGLNVIMCSGKSTMTRSYLFKDTFKNP